MATLYENGLGTGKDLNQAAYWRNVADYDYNNNTAPEPIKKETHSVPAPPVASVETPVTESEQDNVIAEQKEEKPTIWNAPKKSKEKELIKKRPVKVQKQPDNVQSLDFIDMITPSVLDFKHPDYFVCGNTFRSVWAIREYPTGTKQLAILRDLGEKSGVTLHIYIRPVSASEETNIIKLPRTETNTEEIMRTAWKKRSKRMKA